MNQLQLYINDQLVDLSDDSPIALTFQINNLAEVQNQQGNTSNQFKLPLTQRNRIILGFPDDIAFTTNLPYQQYHAKLIQDGLEILPYGIAELNGVEQDSASITVLSGNVNFFDAIDGKLYDIGDSTSIWSNYGQNLVWKHYDHTWNVDNVADSQTNTEGWIWPIVDYGAIDATNFSNPINVRYQRPGFFIKTAIDLLLKSSGYTGTGSLLVDPLYPLMIAQFSNGSFEHGTDYQNEPDSRGLSVAQSMITTLNHPNDNNPGGNLYWDTIEPNGDQSNQFTDRQYFTSKTTNNVTITVTFPHVYLIGVIAEKSTKLTIHIYYHENGTSSNLDATLLKYDISFEGHGEKKPGESWSDPNGWTRLNGSDGSDLYGEIDLYKIVMSCQTTMAENDTIYIGYVWDGRPNGVVNIFPSATLVVKSQNQTVQFGDTIQCERIFPDISQKDLLKDTLQRFGIVCQTDNASKTISFNSFRDIVNNIPIAKDWSSKCLNQGKQVAFKLGNYAQLNYMQYQTDENILPLKYGWSQINIPDQTLPANATLFNSPFGPSLNRPFYGGSISQITMIDATSDSMDFSISVAPRILIDHKLDLRNINSGVTVTFTDGNGNNRYVNDIISTPYFYKDDGEYSLMFEDLRKKYYPEFQKILTQTKKVVRYILLTPRDILELDMLIPVYIQQDSAYYYINKIDAWRKGQPTKVELVKLG